MFKFYIVLFFLVICMPLSTMAKTTNLFILHRINYKPHKQLRYDLNYDDKSCTININSPLDVYYEEISSGKRISHFSSNSQKYFAPYWKSSNVSPRKLRFSFKSMDEIKKLLGPSSQLTVYLDQVGTQCQITTEVSYPGTSFDLRHIAVDVKLTLGFPTGVRSVELQGVKDGSYYVKKIQAP